MTSHNVQLDEDSYKYLKDIKGMLPKKAGREASFSDAVKYHQKLNRGIYGLIRKNFEDLNSILLTYYQGNSSKAHISEQLRGVLIQAIKDEAKYKKVSEGLYEIMRGFKE